MAIAGPENDGRHDGFAVRVGNAAVRRVVHLRPGIARLGHSVQRQAIHVAQLVRLQRVGVYVAEAVGAPADAAIEWVAVRARRGSTPLRLAVQNSV